MNRNEMVQKITDLIDSCNCRSSAELANQILSMQEDAGMAPPSVCEDKVQALMHVYYAGYTAHQWDENFEKDEKVMDALRRRAEVKERRHLKSRLCPNCEINQKDEGRTICGECERNS